MIKLDDIVLPDDILQTGIEQAPNARVKKFITLDGDVVNVLQPINDCREIDLYGNSNTGWMTYGVYKMLLQKSLNVNGVYNLIYEDYSLMVRFRYEDPPVLSYTPILERPNLQDNDYVYCTIKLKEVQGG